MWLRSLVTIAVLCIAANAAQDDQNGPKIGHAGKCTAAQERQCQDMSKGKGRCRHEEGHPVCYGSAKAKIRARRLAGLPFISDLLEPVLSGRSKRNQPPRFECHPEQYRECVQKAPDHFKEHVECKLVDSKPQCTAAFTGSAIFAECTDAEIQECKEKMKGGEVSRVECIPKQGEKPECVAVGIPLFRTKPPVLPPTACTHAQFLKCKEGVKEELKKDVKCLIIQGKVDCAVPKSVPGQSQCSAEQLQKCKEDMKGDSVSVECALSADGKPECSAVGIPLLRTRKPVVQRPTTCSKQQIEVCKKISEGKGTCTMQDKKAVCETSGPGVVASAPTVSRRESAVCTPQQAQACEKMSGGHGVCGVVMGKVVCSETVIVDPLPTPYPEETGPTECPREYKLKCDLKGTAFEGGKAKCVMREGKPVCEAEKPKDVVIEECTREEQIDCQKQAEKVPGSAAMCNRLDGKAMCRVLPPMSFNELDFFLNDKNGVAKTVDTPNDRAPEAAKKRPSSGSDKKLVVMKRVGDVDTKLSGGGAKPAQIVVLSKDKATKDSKKVADKSAKLSGGEKPAKIESAKGAKLNGKDKSESVSMPAKKDTKDIKKPEDQKVDLVLEAAKIVIEKEVVHHEKKQA